MLKKLYMPRWHVMQQLKEVVLSTIENNGWVIIPAYAAGRSQELLMALTEIDPPCPIYYDGMGREIFDIFLDERYAAFFRDHKQLTRARERVHVIEHNLECELALKEPSVIVASGGNLSGGSILRYFGQVAHHKDSSLILTGYQPEQTQGRALLDSGKTMINGELLKPSIQVHSLNFSQHNDKDDIRDTIIEVDPDLVILQHGEDAAIDALMKICKEDLRVEAIDPRNGDRIPI